MQPMGLGTVWLIGAATMGFWSGYIGFEVGKEDHRASNSDLPNWERGICTPGRGVSDFSSPTEITDETTLDELAKDALEAGIASQAGQGTEEIAEVVEDSAQHEIGVPNPSLPARYAGPSTPFPEPMELGGSASTRSRDLDDSGRAGKEAKVSAPAQQIMAAMEIDHEDEPNLTQFLDEDLDYMEDYDYNIEDEQVTDENFEGDLESMLDRLSRPYSKEEPMMDVEELQELDALADLVEITRL